MRQSLLLLGLICLLPSFAMSQRVITHPYNRVIKLGDDTSWADPGLDDKDWDQRGKTHQQGNFWVRMRIQTGDWMKGIQNPGVQVISLGSFEMYWDGVLVGKNGEVGKEKEEEVVGTFVSHILIPDSLLSYGEHVVAFRVSNHHWSFPFYLSWNTFILEEYMGSFRADLSLAAIMLICAGLYLMASLYYFLLYMLRKRENVGLIFSVLCLIFFGLIVMEYAKFLYAYPYPFHIHRLLIIFGLTFLMSYLTPFFFLLYFQLPHRYVIIGLLLIAPVWISLDVINNADSVNYLLSLNAWWTSMAIVCYATISKRKESRVIFLVLLASGLISQLHQMDFRALLHKEDITLFIGLSLLVVSMMYLLARRAREQRQAYEESLLLSSRLQNELLKKNIQPHFIMNTLTSLMEWIEESPKDSVQFIEALSKEFEIMSDIAEKKLIPIHQEIELCQYHIQIMRYRKEIDYQLHLENIPTETWIPPAIFHTIIENAITHSKADAQNRIQMIISFEQKPEANIYSIKTLAENRAPTPKEPGTGFRYIESRLRENYGDSWEFESQAIAEGWLSTIKIFIA